jgi:hypothetical protein
MTPDMVHYGSVPETILNLEVENVRRIMDAELAGSELAEQMRALTKVSGNAMKQYRRTRPEASRAGSRRAKAILEGTKLETGQRVGGTAIPPHPLLQGLEMSQYEDNKKKGRIGTLNDLENIRKRQEFLQAMAQFRPKETVFEAFATGGGKDVGVASQVDKGRTSGSKKNDSSFALTAMKNMRRQLKMARNKGSALVVAGSEFALEMNADTEDVTGTPALEQDGDADNDTSGTKRGSLGVTVTKSKSVALPDMKRRLSKAERRRLKKNPNAPPSAGTSIEEQNKKSMRGSDFRDPAFFIENDAEANPAEAQRLRQVEAAMQPSAANSFKGTTGTALRMEEAMLDIVGDENDELVQKQRMMRWDKSKRKYIQTTVGAERTGDSRSKKLKLESGQIVKSDKMKLGEFYRKWQKKTNRSIGRDGVFDNPTNDDDVDSTPCRGRRGGKSSKQKGGMDKAKDKDKPKSAKAIKKDREGDQDMKLKNMKKEDRRRLERNKTGQGSEKGAPVPKKGSQGKRGMSGRWAGGKGKNK